MLDEPFRGSHARALGLLTRGQLQGPRYRRVFPDVYAPADLPLDLANRSRAAYLLVERIGGVLAGHSAAELLGAGGAPAHAAAEVLVPRFHRSAPGLRVRFGTPRQEDVEDVDGCRITGPLRTAWDLSRRLKRVEAVVAVDALARCGRFSPGALLNRRALEPGARGCRRLDDVVALSDPRSESPMETRLRLGLIRAGLPVPEVQYRVLDEYGFVLARVDLAYPDVRLAIEYDGRHHLDPLRARRDHQRDAELAGYGWETLRLGPDDVEAMPQTCHRIRRLLALRAA